MESVALSSSWLESYNAFPCIQLDLLMRSRLDCCSSHAVLLLHEVHFRRVKLLLSLIFPHRCCLKKMNRWAGSGQKFTVPLTDLKETENNWGQDVIKVKSFLHFLNQFLYPAPRAKAPLSFLWSSNVGFSRSSCQWTTSLIFSSLLI